MAARCARLARANSTHARAARAAALPPLRAAAARPAAARRRAGAAWARGGPGRCGPLWWAPRLRPHYLLRPCPSLQRAGARRLPVAGRRWFVPQRVSRLRAVQRVLRRRRRPATGEPAHRLLRLSWPPQTPGPPRTARRPQQPQPTRPRVCTHGCSRGGERGRARARLGACRWAAARGARGAGGCRHLVVPEGLAGVIRPRCLLLHYYYSFPRTFDANAPAQARSPAS
ncbi:MAG: hypothetical protein J3K34DRAFT_267483 [Monoraphidium minutum]|nr:MAG: hypothetical protein J3K34DRAFT_267483 [Monoraphidium minutum]